MRIKKFNCFGSEQGGGNPALVVIDGPAEAAARLALARERALTCVFIDPAGELDVAATLDFVYPHARSPLCLHATLAAARVLFEGHGGATSLTVKTAMHGQRLTLSRDGADIFVGLAPQAAPQLAIDAALPARLLGAPGLQLASAPVIASVGSPKLLLEVADAATLYRLVPDLEAIVAWGRAHGVNGCYVWCRIGEGECEGRNFNHLDPALEDSATGVAAGALTLALGHGLLLHQGRMSGRDCLMQTMVEGGAVLVGGRVEAC
jgi:PhzF family phenazine biosynthesis protein